MKLTLLIALLVLCSTIFAQVTILDAFESNVSIAFAKCEKVNFASSKEGAEANITMTIEEKDSFDPYAKIDVDISNPGSYAGVAYLFENSIDFEEYAYLSLYYKKSNENIGFRIQFKDYSNNESVYLSHSHFITKNDNENGWAKIIVPLENVMYKCKQIDEIVIVFEESQASLYNYSKEGVVYLNDMFLGGAELGYFVINAVEISAAFSQYEKYSGDFILKNSSDATIEYILENNQYGGAFFKISEDYSLSLSDYRKLEVDLFAPTTEQNCGNIKVELKNDSVTSDYRITGISSTEKKTFTIPIDSFSNPIQTISEAVIVLEKNKIDNIEGQLCFSNFTLRKEVITIDTSFFEQILIIQNNDTISDLLQADEEFSLLIPGELENFIESVHFIVNDSVLYTTRYNTDNTFNYLLDELSFTNESDHLQIKINLCDGSVKNVERKIKLNNIISFEDIEPIEYYSEKITFELFADARYGDIVFVSSDTAILSIEGNRAIVKAGGKVEIKAFVEENEIYDYLEKSQVVYVNWNVTESITTCDSCIWIDGITYTESNNTATYTLASSTGCDSTVTLNLTINKSTTGTDVIEACDSYTWIDGKTYIESNNTATYTIATAAGCDSTVSLNLIVNKSTTSTDVIESCDSYTWIDGITYTESNNTATYTLASGAGCDSTVSLNLIINKSSTGTDVIESYDSYTWIDGITYTESNDFATYTLTNIVGCDSIITLDLKIIKESTYIRNEAYIDLKVYPNPFSEVLFISWLDNNLENNGLVQIFSIDGRFIVYSQPITEEIDLSFLKAGVYQLVIYNKEDLIYRNRLIKKE